MVSSLHFLRASIFKLKVSQDAAFDMTDEAGTRLDGIKIKIQLALISKPPQDIVRKVDAAISHLDDSVLSQISNAVAASPSAIVGSYTPSDYINNCIPSLGQAFASTVKIARKFGHASLFYVPFILNNVYNLCIRLTRSSRSRAQFYSQCTR